MNQARSTVPLLMLLTLDYFIQKMYQGTVQGFVILTGWMMVLMTENPHVGIYLAPFSRRSKKQSCVTLSTEEAK